jgi:multiple sugar transport system substrate-binding protein
MTSAFQAFQSANPALTVELQTAPGSPEGEAKLQSLFAARTPPEVFASVFTAGLMDYVYRDLLVDLTPYIQRDALDQSDFSPAALNTFTFGGKQYGLPRGGIPSVMFYNKDLFDAAGVPYPPADWEDPSWTWERMLEMARELTRDTDGDGQVDQYGIFFPMSANTNFYNQVALMWGQSMWPDELYSYGLARTHNLANPVVVEAMQRVADLTWVEQVAPPPGVFDEKVFFGPFLSGKVAMSGELGAYVAPGAAPFRWGVAALPRGAADIQQRATTFTGPLLIGAGAANTEGGWELLKYLTGPEGQRYLMQGAAVGTSRQSLYDEWMSSFKAPKEEILAVQTGGYAHGLESPNVRTVAWSRLSGLLASAFEPVWLGERSAADAVSALDSEITGVLETTYTENSAKAKTLFADFPG